MKAESEPFEITHKIRGIAAILIAMVFLSAFIINSMPNQPSTNKTVPSLSQPKVAIVDHLSLTFPNQTFVETITNILKQVGYTVDYYPGENVTVELYRNLPTYGYKLVIFRVHSGLILGGGDSIFLFTSEPYSTQKYVYEQLTDQIALTRLYVGGSPYFGINEKFVKSSMKGTFTNTTIIMMGCNCMRYTTMAEAFVEKGAKACVGWNMSVSASNTDIVTMHLLQHLFIEKKKLKDAVSEAMKEVEPEPDLEYKTYLTYYPTEAGEQTVANVNDRG